MNAGAMLKDFRTRRGLSQSDLALAVGVTAPTISHYENRSRAPGIGVIRTLKDALALTSDEFEALLTAFAMESVE